MAIKVALDATPLSVQKSGIGEYTYQLALHLARRYPEDEFLLLSNFPFPPVPGATNLRSKVCSTGWVSGRWWLVGLPRILQREGVSIFHGSDYAIPLVPILPCVLSIHDLSSLRFAHLHERRTRRTARRLPWMVRVAAHVVTQSVAVREEVIERFRLPREKVSVIPVAPGPQFHANRSGDERLVLQKYDLHQPFILFVGTLEPRKNLVSLVRAYAALPTALLYETQLVLCGRAGWKNDALQAEIVRLGLERKVRVTGYISDAELPALYRSATVFVYPSLYEGFGLPPLEAMASGVPVIASTDPALTEVLGNATIRIASFDVGGMSEALESLLRSESQRVAYRSKGLAHVRRFSWDDAADKTYRVYQRILTEYRSGKWGRLYRTILQRVNAAL